jgi:hypothetical protein
MENGSPASVESDVREWLGQRDALKKKLLSELDAVKARAKALTELLREMGVDDAQEHAQEKGSPKPRKPPTDLKSATMPELITMVVKSTPGIDISTVIAKVRELRQSVKAANVYPSAYRMVDDGRLRRDEKDLYYAASADREVAT